jgi:hypothetical protein
MTGINGKLATHEGEVEKECPVTVAVCIKCGAMKRGALTPCVECHFYPHEHEDMGKSMVLTDDLKAISERIKSGQSVTYPEDTVREYAEMFAQIPNVEVSPWEDRLIFTFVLVMIGLTILIVWLL